MTTTRSALTDETLAYARTLAETSREWFTTDLVDGLVPALYREEDAIGNEVKLTAYAPLLDIPAAPEAMLPALEALRIMPRDTAHDNAVYEVLCAQHTAYAVDFFRAADELQDPALPTSARDVLRLDVRREGVLLTMEVLKALDDPTESEYESEEDVADAINAMITTIHTLLGVLDRLEREIVDLTIDAIGELRA